MIDLDLIYEKAVADAAAKNAMLQKLMRRYEIYRSRHTEYREDVEGFPVKKILIKDNYFSMYCQQHLDEIGIEKVVNEFAVAKSKNQRKRLWNRVNVHQYENILKKFVKDGEHANIPVHIVTDQIDKICECTLDIIAFETIANLVLERIQDQYLDEALMYDDYSLNSIVTVFQNAFNDQTLTLDDVESLSEELYEWAAFADHKCTSDYGPIYVVSHLGNLSYDPSLSEAVVALNKCVDVVHASNELSLAFISGGANALNAIRYGDQISKTSTNWITGEEVDNSRLQAVLDDVMSAVRRSYAQNDTYALNEKDAANIIYSIICKKNEKFADDVKNMKPAFNKFKDAAKELASNYHEILSEQNIYYVSNEIRDILCTIMWLQDAKYVKSQNIINKFAV